MSPKKHSQHDAAAAKQSPSRREAANVEPSPTRVRRDAVVRRAALAPGSLTPRDVLQLQRAVGNRAVSKLLAQAARRQSLPRKENRTGLPDNLKAGIENLSGLSLDDVRVHYNSSKPAALQALAYTQGADIHVGPGQEQHLPHEAWHAVQQKRGRVQPTVRLKETPINDDAALENEADEMCRKALNFKSTADEGVAGGGRGRGDAATATSSAASQRVVQRSIGLELEFPIPIDPLGTLTEGQKTLLEGPMNEERKNLQLSANMDKDQMVFEDKDGGYRAVVDHQENFLGSLAEETPAKVIYPNILEFVFKPPVEYPLEIYFVLESIFEKVNKISTDTSGLTKRVKLKDDVYVGPINTDAKPAALRTKSNSLQVNIGVETSKLTAFFKEFAGASELKEQGDNLDEYRERFRDVLTKSAALGEKVGAMVKQSKEFEELNGTVTDGLEGIAAAMTLYLRLGELAEGGEAPGTIKNFTPLLFKTSLDQLATRTLTKPEADYYAAYKETLIKYILRQTRGKEATLEDLLVKGAKGTKAGAKVKDLIAPQFQAPFIVSGKGVAAKQVVPEPLVKSAASVKDRKGAVVETRLSAGEFDLKAANDRAQEIYKMVSKVHGG